jgi:hypothetical protein
MKSRAKKRGRAQRQHAKRVRRDPTPHALFSTAIHASVRLASLGRRGTRHGAGNQARRSRQGERQWNRRSGSRGWVGPADTQGSITIGAIQRATSPPSPYLTGVDAAGGPRRCYCGPHGRAVMQAFIVEVWRRNYPDCGSGGFRRSRRSLPSLPTGGRAESPETYSCPPGNCLLLQPVRRHQKISIHHRVPGSQFASRSRI